MLLSIKKIMSKQKCV